MARKAKNDWEVRIKAAFNAFSPIPFSVYKRRTISPVLKLQTTLPSSKNVYKALELVPFEKVKVVFLGQDPYYQAIGRDTFATGLAFALNPKILKKTALNQLRGGKSLRTIFKALANELGKHPSDTSLLNWAKQGVLLLNTALTTQHGKPGAHSTIWRGFSSALILALSASKKPISFVLTCKQAKQLRPLIAPHHRVYLNHKHPSRCWRVTTEQGKQVNFFSEMTRLHQIQWNTPQ